MIFPKATMVTKSQEEYKLSLVTAILININCMLGAGLFINTPELAKRAGFLGAFNYVLVGILMLPLILSIAELLRLHPSGGFYTYAQREISPFAGFFSGWSYFISKLASCMLMIHMSMTLIRHIFPALADINIYFLDIGIICLFVALNMFNLKAGSAIQKMFIVFKTIPIFFVILSGLFFFHGSYTTSATDIDWAGISLSLPLVLYAVVGFEAACSVSSRIKDAHKNAPRAVLISFGIVILVAFLYQYLFYAMLGPVLAQQADYRTIFPALLNAMFGGNEMLIQKLKTLFHLTIASSTLGAAYGVLFSNAWNLYTLAQHNHVWFSKIFSSFNRHLIPYACILTEGVLCVIYLFVSQGNNVPLQQIGALGCVIAYLFSVVSLLYAKKNNPQATINSIIPWLGVASCLILFASCIHGFIIKGMSSLITYTALIGFGIIMYCMTSNKNKTTYIKG